MKNEKQNATNSSEDLMANFNSVKNQVQDTKKNNDAKTIKFFNYILSLMVFKEKKGTSEYKISQIIKVNRFKILFDLTNNLIKWQK